MASTSDTSPVSNGDEDDEDERAIACPRCGCSPKVRIRFSASKQAWGVDLSPEVTFTVWFECRRWFGLLCRRGSERTNTRDWIDLALRRAARAWNEDMP